MPSPNGTNFARLYINVPGLAYDEMPRWARRLARDDYEPPKDDVAVAVTDMLNFLKTVVPPDQFKKAELLAGKVMQLSRKRIADHNEALNEASSNGEATDDNDDAQGAYPPKATGNLSMDSRRPWAKPDTAQADSRKRLLDHMRRIGSV
jgi:hypothetical protein